MIPPDATTAASETADRPASATWVRAIALSELPVGGQTVFRHQRRPIAIFRPTRDEVYALDDRCPHEGYPLSKGSLNGDVLTCCWHNFKFDVRSGQCLKGDENVRWFETRIRDEAIELQVADEPAEVLVPRYVESLEAGLYHRRMGQVARDVVRLMKAGVEPGELALMAARYDAEHAEYGTGHALPVALDVLHLTNAYPELRAALPLLQAFETAAETCVRLPKRAASAPSDAGTSAPEAGRKLRFLVEAEQAESAEALMRGALARGWGPDVIEPWLLGLCADHFLGFGHGLIYTVKAFDLLTTVGWHHAPEILPGLLFSIINQTREELLPEWRWFRERLAAVQPRLATFSVVREGEPPAGYDESLIRAILDGSREEAFDSVAKAMSAGCHVDTIVNALSVAASERIMRFDVSIDGDSAVQEGWLAVTHPFTFVNAARSALRRYADPQALVLLFQAARFINNARSLDATSAPEPVTSKAAIDVTASMVADAIRAQQSEAAVALAGQYLAGDKNPRTLELALHAVTFEDRAVRPIVVGHLIKTCRAAFDERDSLPAGPHRSRAVMAYVRVASSPVRQRWIARFVHEAIRFVDEGKVPKTLT